MSKRPRFEEPRPGFVIRYSYLWRDEARRGLEEGVKARPCAVVLTTKREGQELRVYVAPVTHTQPTNATQALEIPAATKRRLGLDDTRSWVITSELNIFTWPGYDIRRVEKAGDSHGYAYGILPRAMALDLVKAILKQQRSGRLRAVNRDAQ